MHILVHFQAFPVQTLLKCVSPEDSEHFYFHSLKQALYVLHGKTRAFNDLAVEQQQALWQAVRCSERSLFESIGMRFRPALPVENQQLKNLKALPVRLLRRSKPIAQRPVPLWKASSATPLNSMIGKVDASAGGGGGGEEGAPINAATGLSADQSCAADGEPSSDAINSSSGAAGDSEESMKSLEDVLVQDFGAVLGVRDSEGCRSLNVMIQGIVVPWEAPIYDVWRLMAHCDLFLYIIVLSDNGV